MNKVYKIKNPARAGSKWWQIILYCPMTFGELAQNGTKVQHKKTPLGRGLNGGRDRDRTDDLLVANEALSQLSYTPDKSVYGTAVTRTYLL